MCFAAVSRMEIHSEHILIEDYTYDLPAEKIAAFPLEKRDQSKLLVYQNGSITDDFFYNLPNHLPGGVALFLNDTRVVEARILFTKTTGAVVEIFCLEPFEQSIEQGLQQTGKVLWKCMIGGASKWKHGQVLTKQFYIEGKAGELRAKYVRKEDESFLIEFEWTPAELPFVQVMHIAGALPLPPYIKRIPDEIDAERYQTIFSHKEGSVAAPTAALHFTDNVFERLRAKEISLEYITLHVGAGTFKPVKTETIAEHTMHSEMFSVSIEIIQKLINTKTVVAVGTTTLRTIETLYWLGIKLMNGLIKEEWELNQWEPYHLNYENDYKSVLKDIINWMKERQQERLHCRTSLIIVPGYQFKIADAIVTNFHQPQSTLLLLVAAFVGPDWKKIYNHALANEYRFLSYGDSSLLWRNDQRKINKFNSFLVGILL